MTNHVDLNQTGLRRDNNVDVRMTDEELDMLRELSAKWDRDRSKVLRRLVMREPAIGELRMTAKMAMRTLMENKNEDYKLVTGIIEAAGAIPDEELTLIERLAKELALRLSLRQAQLVEIAWALDSALSSTGGPLE